MDYVLKAAVTASLVALVMFAARRWGGNMAGLLAGLPLTTVPALAWIGLERGAAVAAQVSIGSVVGCSLAPIFALVYDRVARRLSPAATLVVGIAVLSAGVGVASQLESSLWLASTLAPLLGVAALTLMGGRIAHAPATTLGPRFVLAISAMSAALVSVVLSLVAVDIGPRLAGVLTALPIVGIVTVAAEHAGGGPAAVTTFLRGYVTSSLGRSAFGAVFATCALSHGIAAAMCAALGTSVALCIVAHRIARRCATGHPVAATSACQGACRKDSRAAMSISRLEPRSLK